MHQFKESSFVKQKRESFYNQIRSRFKNQYFAAQRKLLFHSQLNSQSLTKTNRIQSLEQLQNQLKNSFLINFQAINTFMKQNPNIQIPIHLQQQFISHSLTQAFLKNEDALVSLVTLWNMKCFSKQLITEQIVKIWIDGIIQYNIVLQDSHHLIYRINYFTTVCWALFALATILHDKKEFLKIKSHLHIIEYQGQNLDFAFIALISQLSTYPQLLPSQAFISSLLQKQTQFYRNQKFMIFVVNLLDKYLSYNAQELCRFQNQENVYLINDYIKFINRKLKDVKFPNYVKVQLIKLMNKIFDSCSMKVILKIFQTRDSRDLCTQLFYRAEFDQQESQRASLICFVAITCKSDILGLVTELIGAQKIARLFQDHISINDRYIQFYMLACIQFLLESLPQVYINFINVKKFAMQIKQIELFQQKNHLNQYQQHQLSEAAHFIYQNYLDPKKH